MENVEIIQNLNILRLTLSDDGTFPNNSRLPLLIYRHVIKLPQENKARFLENLFAANDWVNAWVDGIYSYHHYHSTAHEVLGIFKGSARVQFGGTHWPTHSLEEGDVVIIPAGVAHKSIEMYDSFACVGAYPLGQQFDMNYGQMEEREKAFERIRSLETPMTDPVYGTDGPLISSWSGHN